MFFWFPAKAAVAVVGGGESLLGQARPCLSPSPGTWGATGLVPAPACPRPPVHGGGGGDGMRNEFPWKLVWRQPQRGPRFLADPSLCDLGCGLEIL